MELRGKKIAFLGDSITEGHTLETLEHVYWKTLEKATGAKCYGYGIGGTRIAPQMFPSEYPRHDLYFASRVDEMIPDADVVVVFGGTNDFGHGDAPFGTFQDTTEETFCGAMHVLLQKLIARYPYAQIVVMTPLHRDSEDRILNSRGLRAIASLRDYVDAIIEICGYYSIPVLDLFRVSGLQPKAPPLKELYMPDGLHPNKAGHDRIAQRLLGFLNTL